jgi:hypothetical protein
MKRYTALFSPKFGITTSILVVVLLLAAAVSLAVPLALTSRELEQKPAPTTPSQLSDSSRGSILKEPTQPLLTPAAHAISTATFTPTPLPTNTGVYRTLLPGIHLPSEAECVARVHRSSWEPRPDNHAANHRMPTAKQIAGLSPWGPDNGQDAKADALRRQITGGFIGTTDEILRWVACKWGIDVNIVRAQAVAESYWFQRQRGDQTNDSTQCPPGTWNGSDCYQSFGILQIKYIYNKTAWPMSRDDTAFNAEYMYGIIRACYEGWTTYLYDRTPVAGYPRYHPGDIWGCVGRWYSGSWYDQGALAYIKSVKMQMANKTWQQPGF